MDFDFDKDDKSPEPQGLEALLQDLVGEDKKYKTIEDAVKSITPAQDHINRLEQELAELRGNLDKSKTQEELLEEMRKELQTMQTQQPQADDTDDKSPEPSDPNKDDKSDNKDDVDIESLIQAKLDQAKAEQIQRNNIESVTKAALAAWGNDTKTKFYETARANGYDEAMIKALAATSPAAALHALGLKDTGNISGNQIQGTLRTNSPEFQKVEEPTPPSNWGNDDEVAKYMAELQKYEDSKGN